MFVHPHPARCLRRGFALVIVLLVLSLLAVIAVGYLSSMSSERATANAFGNETRAAQAAQAGVDTAIGILRDSFKAFPDSATAWDTAQSKNTDGTSNEGTTLYLHAVPLQSDMTLPDPAPGISDPKFVNADYTGGNGPNNVDGTSGVDNRKIFVLPLVSGATFKPLANKGNALPTPSPTSFVNLNSRRQLNDAQGWIGSPPGYVNPTNTAGVTLPKPFCVPWVEITQKDMSTGSSPTPSPSPAPVVGRYAYWVEDESFRANISYANLGTGATFQRRDNTQNYLLNPTDANLLGVLGLMTVTNPQTVAQNILNARAVYPGNLFPEATAFAHTAGLTPDNINGLRYLTTSLSSALNLTRHGTQRLNLNEVMYPPSSWSFTTPQNQIDKIVKTLAFHAPNFGQRLYRNAPTSGLFTDPSVLNSMAVTHDPTNTTSTGNYANIYNYKVAANIHDYIGASKVPTCILNTGLIRPPGAPSIPSGDNGDNTVWAYGKNAAPYMQEGATRFTGTVTGTTFVMTIDYYIEFWNMSPKDVSGPNGDLGPNPFLRISNPTRWQVNNSKAITGAAPVAIWGSGANLISDDTDNVSPSSTRPTSTSRDYKIDLSKVVFKAGQVTLITTDTNYAQIIKDTTAQSHTVVCPWLSPGKSLYKGHFPAGRPTAGADVLDMVFDTSPAYGSASSSSDYETDVTVGSDLGYIDCLEGAIPLTWGGRIDYPYTGSSSNFPYIFGGQMRGNWTNDSTATNEGFQTAALGDPRTNNEQLVYSLNPSSSTASIDRSRYVAYEIAAGSNTLTPVPGSPNTGVIQTLGQPNYRSVRPNRPENPWPDLPAYYGSPDSNPTLAEVNSFAGINAPMPIANAPLTSIGQLGDLFDPSRNIDGCTVGGSRGGGRSFKIGQHDDRWDGDQASASRTWAAWRLADMFTITDNMEQPGLININGVNRDGGAALRAAVNGLRFQPDAASASVGAAGYLGDPKLADPADTTVPTHLQINELITEITNRLSPLPTTPVTGVNQTGVGPFWERGELSELPGFGRSPDPIKPSGSGFKSYPETALVNASSGTTIDMSANVLDRGREELFRRLVGMTTTRGNVFTVYVLGQAINQTNPNDATTKRVTGTQQLKVTFRLVPKRSPADSNGITKDFHPATDDNGLPVDFDPSPSNSTSSTPAIETRFAKPDHYEAQILSISSTNS